MTTEEDRILRASVPERWKQCTSPIGAVQSYIAELEQALLAKDPLALDRLAEETSSGNSTGAM